MSRATSQMRELSQALIACATRANKTSGITTPAAFHVCARLQPHLATLMGKTGFTALLSRALTLAHAEVPWLRTLQVKADGSLESVSELQVQVDSEQAAEGSIVLVAQLLGLLVTFIGETLTLRLLREVWPKLSPKVLTLGKGDQK